MDGYIGSVRYARIFALRNRSVLPVIHAHDDAPRCAVAATIAVLADLVANNTTANSADNGGSRAAIALADRATKHATGNSADHGAQGAAVAVAAALNIDLVNLLHDAAVLATVAVAGALLIATVLRGGATGQRDTHGQGKNQGELD